MSPTSEQVLGALRIILTALMTVGLTQLSKRGYIGDGEVAVLAGALCTIGLAVWSWIANSLTARATSVSNSGAKVVVHQGAPKELVELARDPAAPNVVMGH